MSGDLSENRDPNAGSSVAQVVVADDPQLLPSDPLGLFKSLLERQIDLARLGNISEVEVLVRHTSTLVETLAKTGLFESAEYKLRHAEFQALYDRLSLILNAQRSETIERIRQIRKGRKTVGAYRMNL